MRSTDQHKKNISVCPKCLCRIPCIECLTKKLCDITPLCFDTAHIVAEYCDDGKIELIVFARTFARWQYADGLADGLAGLAYSA